MWKPISALNITGNDRDKTV